MLVLLLDKSQAEIEVSFHALTKHNQFFFSLQTAAGKKKLRFWVGTIRLKHTAVEETVHANKKH